ncbi:MAG: putative Ig domain-containing protein, partial [Acidobacteriota bacterium]
YRALEGNISFNPFANCFFNDSCNVREIATHELGHALGLGHSRDTDASLFAYAHFDGRCGAVRPDDEAGIRFLYPQITQIQLPQIQTSALPTIQAESPYNFDLSANGGAPPYRWQVTNGTLPSGMLLLGSGSLRGTPLAAGESVVTIQVTDSVNQSVQKQFVLKVSPKPSISTPTPDTSYSKLLFYPLDSPVRWFDSRSTTGACTSSRAPLNVVSPLKVRLVGSCSRTNIPSSARVIVGQITVINLTQSPGNYQVIAGGATPSTVGVIAYAPLQTLTTTFVAPLGDDGSVDIYSTHQVHVMIDITGYFGAPTVGGLYFHPLDTPLRISDTTGATGACRSLNQPLGTGATHIERATISCGGVTIPSSARYIVGNATMTNVTAFSGFATLYPARVPRPGTVTLQLAPFSNATNQVIVGLDQNGLFNTYTSAGAHFAFDIMGYFDTRESGLSYYSLNRSIRLVETRLNESGCFSLSRPINANQEVLVPALGNCSGIVLPSNAESITGYTTVYNQSQMNGTLVLYPDDQLRPATVNLHYLVNRLTSNSFTVKLGELGSFKVEAGHLINLSIDLTGYFAP